MFVGIHNHDNLSDPDAYASEASFVKGLSFSPDSRRSGHRGTSRPPMATASASSSVITIALSAFTSAIGAEHNGRSTPFGEGDAPIIEVLQMIRDNRWPIVALLEFEHGTLRPEVEEVQLMFDYCKRAVSS